MQLHPDQSLEADHLVMQQEDSLTKRATKLRCQLLLATCAVFAHTKGLTQVATDNTVFTASSQSCCKQDLTLQLYLFWFNRCYLVVGS